MLRVCTGFLLLLVLVTNCQSRNDNESVDKSSLELPTFNASGAERFLRGVTQTTSISESSSSENPFANYSFSAAPWWYNASRKNEKWFGCVAPGGKYPAWVFILPDNKMYLWDGSSTASGEMVHDFSGGDCLPYENSDCLIGSREIKDKEAAEEYEMQRTQDIGMLPFLAKDIGIVFKTSYYFDALGTYGLSDSYIKEKWLWADKRNFWIYFYPKDGATYVRKWDSAVRRRYYEGNGDLLAVFQPKAYDEPAELYGHYSPPKPKQYVAYANFYIYDFYTGRTSISYYQSRVYFNNTSEYQPGDGAVSTSKAAARSQALALCSSRLQRYYPGFNEKQCRRTWGNFANKICSVCQITYEATY